MEPLLYRFKLPHSERVILWRSVARYPVNVNSVLIRKEKKMKTGRIMNKFLPFVVILLAIIGAANGRTIYVDDDAAGANDGSSWIDAYKYLQDALAVAIDGDEILVAQGTYQPDRGGDQEIGDRAATFRLMNSVTIIGGYAGVGEQDPDARDVQLYETILSGDLNDNDVEVAETRDLPTEPTRSENSHHVVRIEADVVSDGFTVTGGNADGTALDSIASQGGGIIGWGSPTLINCTFISNSASSPDGAWGGGVNLTQGNPILTNCVFSMNAVISINAVLPVL